MLKWKPLITPLPIKRTRPDHEVWQVGINHNNSSLTTAFSLQKGMEIEGFAADLCPPQKIQTKNIYNFAGKIMKINPTYLRHK